MPRYDPTEPLDRAIVRVLPKADAAGIRKLLDQARDSQDQPLTERVQLACVLLSEGDFGKLKHYVQQAALDFRDVLYWAFEYDDPPSRPRGWR